MKRTPAIILCLAGLFAGVLGGSMLPQATSANATTAKASPTTASSPNRNGGTAKPAKEQKHDLPTLLKKWANNSDYSRNPIVERELERMDAPALRELIGEMMSIFGSGIGNNPDTLASRELIVMASRELYRRDGESALEWATTATGDRELILSWMLNEAAIESPDLAKRWIERMKDAEGFHEGWWQNAIYFAIGGATARGADDLIRLRESYGKLIPEYNVGPATFPPGFEYEKLFKALGTKAPLGDMIQYWSATDRDAAWTAVKEMIDAEGKGISNIGHLLAGAAVQGEENAAKWLIPKIEQLPDAQRVDAVQSLSFGLPSSDAVGFAMAELTRESDRILLAQNFVKVGSTNGKDLAALRGLSTDASRSDVLIASAKKHAPALPNAEPRHVQAVRDYFLRTMESLNLPKNSQAEVMEALGTPAQ